MSRMAEPSQGVLLKLANPLVGETKLGTQLPQRTGWMSVQTIAPHNHPTQAVGKSGEEGAQSLVHQGPISVLVQVRHFQSWRGDQTTRHIICSLRRGSPNVTPDSHPGIGREGCATPRIVPPNGLPETDSTGLQCLLVGQPAASLTPNDGVH